MAIYMTARFRVRPESTETCRQAIAEFVEYVRQNEAGTQLYVSLQETKEAASFLHLFVFQDKTARERHSNSAAVKRFTDVLYSETVAPVEFTEYSLVTSNRAAGV